MSWIIGAVFLYCLFAAALVLILTAFSSRLSQAENFEEEWDTDHEMGETATERNYSHLSSRA